jgi:hypothetical protein
LARARQTQEARDGGQAASFGAADIKSQVNTPPSEARFHHCAFGLVVFGFRDLSAREDDGTRQVTARARLLIES